MSTYEHFWCPFCEKRTTPESVDDENARCTVCGKISWDNRGKPIEMYCPRCDKIVGADVSDDGMEEECTRCHLIRSGPNVKRDYSSWGAFTRSEFPKFGFEEQDSIFIYCTRYRTASSWIGWWCKKLNRPCIGSCEYRRDMKFKRQSRMAEWM